MGKLGTRENLLVLIFAAFVYVVIFFVADKSSRGDISIGFTLGLIFALALLVSKKRGDGNG